MHKKNYRLAQQEDLETIYAINIDRLSHPWNHEQLYNAIQQKQVNIMTMNAHIVAFAIWQIVIDEAELHLIATDKAYIRQHHAQNLIHHFIDQHPQCLSRIFLEVREHNFAARQLYDKLGFQQIAIRKQYYQNPIDNAIIMEKILC